MSTANLAYLEKTWLENSKARHALRRIPQLSPKARRTLVRHHDEFEDGVSDALTHRRDELDYLLGFYGVVEIALMMGFVESVTPNFQATHLRILNDPAIRQYYEVNYPLELPRRLRDRMQLGIQYSGSGDRSLHEVFFRFLDLTELIERDDDLESFLWCLEAGDREDDGGRSNSHRLQKLLAKPERVAQACSRQENEHYEINRAIRGFWKFLQFCEDFSRLLESLKADPAVAEAMWLHHAYWFRQLELEMGDDVRRGIKSVMSWSVGRDDRPTVKKRSEELTQVLGRMVLPPMYRWDLRPIMLEATTVAPEALKAFVTVGELAFGQTPMVAEPEQKMDPSSWMSGFVQSEGVAAAGPKYFHFNQQTGKLEWKPKQASLLLKKLLTYYTTMEPPPHLIKPKPIITKQDLLDSEH